MKRLKALGWFGFYGPQSTLGFFATLGIPAVIGILVLVAELGGAGRWSVDRVLSRA